mmetsp:Transcript_8200/g.19646  ORF Transcript_8200/g.19646 Transcript_8200/m.19646 type:complete len:100 (-) Transcript_8200:1411-1710(-)
MTHTRLGSFKFRSCAKTLKWCVGAVQWAVRWTLGPALQLLVPATSPFCAGFGTRVAHGTAVPAARLLNAKKIPHCFGGPVSKDVTGMLLCRLKQLPAVI